MLLNTLKKSSIETSNNFRKKNRQAKDSRLYAELW